MTEIMNTKANFIALCNEFGIEADLDSSAFVSCIDLKRKSYKVSQEVFCDMVGISRSFYSQCKKGKKGASFDTQFKMLYELKRIRELSEVEENAARFEVGKNLLTGRDKFSSDKITALQQQKEVKEKLWRIIQDKQKLKRTSKEFTPCLDASVDKITLFVRLTTYTEKLFLDMMDRFCVINGNTKYTNNARYKSGKVTEYQHIWQHEGSDCKVHVQYNFYDKSSSTDVRELKVEFNPNKWITSENEMLTALVPFLSRNPRLKEFDVCKDYVGYRDSDVVIPNNLLNGAGPFKIISESDARTLYFGDKNKTVNLMIYDKRKEIRRKDNKDIGYNCLRVESRYKLKPSQWTGTGDNKRFVEYRVKLSNVGNIIIPNKTYSCQAHMVDSDDLLKLNVSVEEMLLVQAVLNGAMSLTTIYNTDKKVAENINNCLSKLCIETLTIGYADVTKALNQFSFKYLSFIDSYYDIEHHKDVCEVWKIKKEGIPDCFEVVGSYCWDTNEFDMDVLDIGCRSTDLIVSRDKDF